MLTKKLWESQESWVPQTEQIHNAGSVDKP